MFHVRANAFQSAPLIGAEEEAWKMGVDWAKDLYQGLKLKMKSHKEMLGELRDVETIVEGEVRGCNAVNYNKNSLMEHVCVWSH